MAGNDALPARCGRSEVRRGLAGGNVSVMFSFMSVARPFPDLPPPACMRRGTGRSGLCPDDGGAGQRPGDLDSPRPCAGTAACPGRPRRLLAPRRLHDGRGAGARLTCSGRPRNACARARRASSSPPREKPLSLTAGRRLQLAAEAGRTTGPDADPRGWRQQRRRDPLALRAPARDSGRTRLGSAGRLKRTKREH